MHRSARLFAAGSVRMTSRGAGARLSTGPGGRDGNFFYKEPRLPPRTYLALIVPATCLGLGTWQVYRRQWKLQLIKEMEQKTQRPPVALPDDLHLLKDMEYEKVLLKGTFDYSRETYIGPRTLLNEGGGLLSGSNTGGVHVVTPLKLADRDLTILVNRGWLPQSHAFPKTARTESGTDEQAASSSTSSSSRSSSSRVGDDEQVVVMGVVRLSEVRQPFTPKTVRSRGMWLRRDVEAIANELDTAPVFVDAVGQAGRQTDRGYPLGSQTRVTLRNEHLSYILTWYSLAALTLWIFYARFVRRQAVGTVRFNRTK